jgi:ribonuclease HIII
MKFKNNYSRDKSIELIEQYCKGREITLIPKDIQYGIQYRLEKGDDKVAINFYDSGTILTQGNKNSLQKDIENYIDTNLDDKALTKLPPKELKGSVSYTLGENKDILNLRNAFEGVEGEKEFEEDIPDHVDYVLNIVRGGTSFKITQYKSLKLLLQGKFSALRNEVVSIADQYCDPPVEDLINGATSEDSQSLVKNGITVDLKTKAQVKVQELIGEKAFDFLRELDQKYLCSSLCLIKITEQHDIPEYSGVVTQASKAFEGFLKSLLRDKGLITREDLVQRHPRAEIGNNLRKQEFIQQLPNFKRQKHIVSLLQTEWELSRNQLMHSDPIDPIELRNINAAKERFSAITKAIRDAYHAFYEYDLDNPSSKNYVNRNIASWIGTDESGKGDYFGPLVVAGVFVNEETKQRLIELGVKDSKKLSDAKIRELAMKIKSTCKYSIVPIGPEKYNELYDQIGNLNKLLAWGHARAIENILEDTDCENALTDQFGDEKFVLNALLKKGKKIKLVQRPRAEEDVGVAAASILARDEFLRKLHKLSQYHRLNLPKGASQQVVIAAREIIRRKGEEELKKIAKLHFKTTKDALGGLKH